MATAFLPEPRRDQREGRLAEAVREYLDTVLPAEAYWHRVPNEGIRTREQHARLIRQGLRPGHPDLAVYYRGRALMIELKVTGGRVTDNQRQCHADLAAAGVPTAVCSSLKRIEAALIEFGIPLKGRLEGIGL